MSNNGFISVKAKRNLKKNNLILLISFEGSSPSLRYHI